MTDTIITEEIILNSETYIPLELKSAMARNYAKDCVSEVEISVENDGAKESFPPRFQENPKMKSLCGMMTLLSNYLHMLKPDENGSITFTTAEYDEWGNACVMNQLDRLKSSKNIEIRNKVYDILDDYREFYRMLGVEIAALVANKNDGLSRFIEYFRASVTPDMIKDVLSQFTGALGEIKEYAEKHKEWDSGDATEGE